MGASGEDVLLSSAARMAIPFQIECKNKAKSQVHTYYNQAKEHGQHEPLVITKMDRDIPLAVLSAETFFQLLKQLYENQNHNPK
jgi:PHD/YefM family antitoxin component YafN of YafNO toxin-antitoxin module